MSARIDLTGKRYGRLVAIRPVKSRGRGARWLCECRCGKLLEVDGYRLRVKVRSCGCWRGERKPRVAADPARPAPATWITKADAITLVWQHQATRAETSGSRNSASNTLGAWRRAGWARTKPAPTLRRDWHKHDPVLYRRADVLGCLSAQTAGQPDVQTADDARDPELERVLRAAQSRRRRRELGIATLGMPREPGMGQARYRMELRRADVNAALILQIT